MPESVTNTHVRKYGQPTKLLATHVSFQCSVDATHANNSIMPPLTELLCGAREDAEVNKVRYKLEGQ